MYRTLISAIFFCVLSAQTVEGAGRFVPDETYLLLGDGQIERALSETSVVTSGTERVSTDALRTRLDVLVEAHALNATAGEEFKSFVQGPGAPLASKSHLGDLFEVFKSNERGDFAAAISQAEALVSKFGPAGADNSADIRFATATALVGLNRLDVAESEARRALKIFKGKHGGRARFREVGTDLLLANIHLARSDYAGALPYLHAAHETAHKQYGAGCDLSVRVDISYAVAYQRVGNYAENFRLCNEAFLAARALHGLHHPSSVRALACVVGARYAAGDDSEGQASLTMLKSQLDSDIRITRNDRERIEGLIGIIEMSSTEPDLPDALEHLRRAYALHVEDGPHAKSNSLLLGNVAEAEYRLGNTKESAVHFKQALATLEPVADDRSYGLVFLLHDTAGIAIKERRFEEAESSLRRAIAIADRIWPNGSFENAALEYALALSEWGGGKKDDAFESARRASEMQLPVLEKVADASADRQSAAFHDQLVPSTALLVTLAAIDGTPEKIRTAWGYVMRERRLVGRRLALRMVMARTSKDPTTLRLLSNWQSASRVMTNAFLGQDTSQGKHDQLQNELENAERAFWSRVGRQKLRGDTVVPSIEQLAANLPADGELVAMAEGLSSEPARTVLFKRGRDQFPEVWFAFVLDKRGTPLLRRIGNINDETAKIQEWYALVRNPHSDLKELRGQGDAVAKDFIDVVGTTSHTIFFLPEGESFRLNLAALPWKSGYFVESGTDVQILTHEADLLESVSPALERKVVLAGAPNFAQIDGRPDATARQTCEQVTPRGFLPIPHAKQELLNLREILSTLPGSQSEVTMLIGKEATSEHVKANLPGADIIHFATHAFALAENCAPASSRSATVISTTKPDAAVSQLASALAFAPDTIDNQIPESSGSILTSEQLATLDLTRARWLVLSACDSGVGPIQRGEGVFGMRRALRIAGVKTVVMSLWEADDEATAAVMQSLYRAKFVDNASVPAALGSAMRQVLADRRRLHLSDRPFYWGTFVAEGSWR